MNINRTGEQQWRTSNENGIHENGAKLMSVVFNPTDEEDKDVKANKAPWKPKLVISIVRKQNRLITFCNK